MDGAKAAQGRALGVIVDGAGEYFRFELSALGAAWIARNIPEVVADYA